MLRNSRLLYRSLKNNNESFPDYLERLSYFNGFSSVYFFIRFLEDFFDYENKDISLYGFEVCDKNSDQFRRYGYKVAKCCVALSIILEIDFDELYFNLTENSLNKYFKARKVCSLCWSESPYYRYYWRFWGYHFCHKHQISLIVTKSITFKEDAALIEDGEYGDLSVTVEKYFRPLDMLIPFCEEKDYGFIELDRISRHFNEESKVWLEIWRFLYRNFGISTHLKAYEVPDWNHEIDSRTSERRFEVALLSFMVNDKDREIVEVVAIIFFSFMGRVYNKNYKFKTWLLSRAYSYSPFLYLCLSGFPNKDGTALGDGLLNLKPIDFRKVSNSRIYEFIMSGAVLSDYQESRLKRRNGSIQMEKWDENHTIFGSHIRFYSNNNVVMKHERFFLDGGESFSRPSEGFVI